MPAKKRKKIAGIILRIFVLILFLFATFYAVLIAYGYRIDFLSMDIFKTSIIDLVGDYPTAKVYLNGEAVAEKVPFQIKNVKPGEYEVSIKNDEFVDWKKRIKVVEDFVTIVDDIKLIPKNTDSLIFPMVFDFIYSDFIALGDNIVFVAKDGSALYKMEFENDGKPSFKTITLLNNILYDKLYAVGDWHIAFDTTDKINIFDLSSGTFTEVLIPDEFLDFKLVYSSGIKGFYFNDGSLFVANIGDKGVFNDIKMIPRVEKVEGLWEYDSFDAYSFGEKIFIKIDSSLYEYKDDSLFLLVGELASSPFISPYGDKIIYTVDGVSMYLYSYDKNEGLPIGNFPDGEFDIRWFHDSKHFVVFKNGEVSLCDLTMENCPVLGNDFEYKNWFSLKTKPLIVLFSEEGFLMVDLSSK